MSKELQEHALKEVGAGSDEAIEDCLA